MSSVVEFDYPPGLGYLRSGGAGMESQRSTFTPADRRGSAGFSIYSVEPSGLGASSSSSYHHHLRHTGPSPPPTTSRSTLFWGDLEPWMDEEYVKQVCALMGWDPISIKIPPPAPDSATGQLANNPGYCLLTFPSQAHAASVLAGLSGNSPINMPNSTKPFVMNWASVVPTASSAPPAAFAPSSTPAAQQPFSKEYSIFVGDLAPETSNSDLVAVFRNPVLGLRNDREPKFIRPFLSCKSAKIMLDPVTGVSRGYGFVRFTDESDQQRALIEMHGLYCLSRPMRISPATAKFKPTSSMTPQDLAQFQQFVGSNGISSDPVTIAVPLPPQPKSVSATIAQPLSPTNATSSATSSSSASSLATASSSSSWLREWQHLTKLYDSNTVKSTPTSSITAPFAQEPPRVPMDYNPAMGSAAVGRYMISEESWKHHTQARAILGNLIGPNGEQLTSTDPYNTTVFVGGLSPLIQEETLRTFFAPFGDIHYVKVPVGKHCGFVQFVRKADAERAIEKMQGFPIGGSRIRLSWGRSQYKAAQAAAQAAQATAMQGQNHHNLYNMAAQAPSSLPSDNGLPIGNGELTQEQAIQLLQKLSQQGYMDPPFSLASSSTSTATHAAGGMPYNMNASTQGGVVSGGSGTYALERMFINPSPTTGLYSEEKLRSAHLSGREDLVGATYDARFDLQSFVSQQQQQPHHVQHGQQSVHQSSTDPHSHPHHPGQHLQQQHQQYHSSSSITGRPAMSFSPFSPDPNARYTSQQTDAPELKRRDSYGLVTSHGAAPSYEQLNDTAAKLGVSTSARPSSASRYSSYQSLVPRSGSGSTGTSPVNRTSMPIPISRPSSGQPAGHGGSSSVAARDPFEMHDLNGTLASLDLGEGPNHGNSIMDSRPWGVKSPAGSSDSSASVQFQMTRDN
ncbi:hypothetical protein BT96DRAFT_933577 [Gymnopus androsaceus JB14]|uniref:RRM domain-containing protein n=1 Tax=Gymnopus androsaceus JB14 TaxID=1447944 RepID=A0A6A4IEK4_9AGAR|nr:hypothetical protein BT96DRAFT_933577 [Gymnopus androsaceus JB14]